MTATPTRPSLHTDYLSKGLAILPLRPRAKKPFGRWRKWMSDPLALDDVDTWWGGAFRPEPNVGIITGTASRGLVVLDVEPEHVQHWMFDESPVRVRTARGGLHLYFRGESLCGKLRARGKVVGDIRGDGGYVVAPPSQTDAGAYTWAPTTWHDWSVDQLPPLPDWAENRAATGKAAKAALNPPVTARLSPSEIATRLPSKVNRMLRGWDPSGAFQSASELDFCVVCEAVLLGQDYEAIVRFFRAYPFGDNLEKHSESYLHDTYQKACINIADSVEDTVELICTRVVVAPGTIEGGAQKRALLQFTDGEFTYDLSIPFLLADGSLSGDWIQICEVYGSEIDESTECIDDREVVATVRGDRVVRLWRRNIYEGFAI